VTGAQKFKRINLSKARASGLGVKDVKSGTVKPSNAHSVTLTQHEKVARSQSNFTVPQPFALATDKRASLGGQVKPLGRNQVELLNLNIASCTLTDCKE
jgi:hypothetical protein